MQGARHVALGLKGSNRANPVGTLRAAVMMLQALDMHEQASLINQSIELTLSEKKVRIAAMSAQCNANANANALTHVR